MKVQGRREALWHRPDFHLSKSIDQMLKSYRKRKGRSTFVSYKPHFHTYPISYIQYLLHQVSSGPFEVTTYPSIYTPKVIRRHKRRQNLTQVLHLSNGDYTTFWSHLKACWHALTTGERWLTTYLAWEFFYLFQVSHLSTGLSGGSISSHSAWSVCDVRSRLLTNA